VIRRSVSRAFITWVSLTCVPAGRRKIPGLHITKAASPDSFTLLYGSRHYMRSGFAIPIACTA